MGDELPPWVTEGIPDDSTGTVGPAFTPPPGAAAVYDYVWPDGFPAFKVVRFDPNGSGKKRFSQYSLVDQEWVPKQTIPAGTRPLFGVQDLDRYFGASVLVVEGEKTAIAARDIIPADWVVVTWAGGSSAAATADWSPLEQRDVLVWPDNDAPGLQAAKAIATRLPQARIVDVPLGFPEGWDLADAPPEGWDVQRLMGWLLADPTKLTPGPSPDVAKAPAAPQAIRPVIEPINWDGQPLIARRWVVDDLIPFHVVTMLSGDGGLGKSTLALQLAIACATGEKWIGCTAKRLRVLVVACEDDPDELHRRTYDILANTAFGFGDLEDIRIISGAGFDNVMVDFEDYANHGKPTEFCEFVANQAADFGAQLIILDSLHDFFAGNENARPQARQFINHLRRMAMDRDGAVLLLAHPSLSGMRDKTGNAGSTAWNNTVRSRLYLSRPDDPEATHLLLETKKANYAANGGKIRLEYRAGCFHSLETKTDTTPAYQAVQVDDVFLTCLRAATKQGRRVTTSTQGNYAPKVFATMKAINRSFGRIDFEKAMSRLFDDGRIKVGEVLDAKRNRREAIVEVLPPQNTPEMDDDE